MWMDTSMVDAGADAPLSRYVATARALARCLSHTAGRRA